MTQASINKLTNLDNQRTQKAKELGEIEKRASELRAEIDSLSRAIDWEIRCGGHCS